MDEMEKRHLVETDPDWINVKRFDFSLQVLLERYPSETPDNIIAQALMMSEQQVADMYERVVQKLREAMKVDPNRVIEEHEP
jgi:hypothetical protein